MNNIDMLASLIAQAAQEGADHVTLRAIVEEASEIGAQRDHFDFRKRNCERPARRLELLARNVDRHKYNRAQRFEQEPRLFAVAAPDLDQCTIRPHLYR